MATGSWDEYFGTRKWRVAAEVTGTDVVHEGREVSSVAGTGLDVQPVVSIKFRGGRFDIDGGVFHSPLSSARGTKGVMLQELDPAGQDIAGSRVAVGIVVFRKARREGAVVQWMEWKAEREDEAPEPQCGGCGVLGGPIGDSPGQALYFIPGGWGWADDGQDGRLGLCLQCGTRDERYRERFAASFGNVVYVSDTDAVQAREHVRE